MNDINANNDASKINIKDDMKKSTKQTKLANFDLFYEELPLYSRRSRGSLATRLVRRSKQ